MVRKKCIEDQQLMLLFEQFLQEQCSNNPTVFKFAKFGDFVRSNGFPNIADSTIRRNVKFRQELDNRLQLFKDDSYKTVITYKTIDIEQFLMTNRTPKAIKSALVELNGHYKRIVESAIEYKKEVEILTRKLNELQDAVEQQTRNETVLNEQEKLNNELIEENKKLKSLLKTSLYPEIANELLKEEGLLKFEHQIVTEQYLKEQVITADSEILFNENKVTTIKGNKSSKSKILNIQNLLDSKTKY